MTGKVVSGKYQVVEKLGSGGSGEVYKAYHVDLKTPWALKIIPSDDELAENELTVLKKLNHPAFPRVVDVVRENGKTIVVFDFYEGPNLQQLIELYGRIDESRVYDWTMQILDALSYLHGIKPEPIIYRDLKPSNLIALDDGTVKLVDFGAARQFKPSSRDDTVYLGTPGYAAPEQYGLGQTDVRTDIYNFGMTVFHLLTGHHPLECNEFRVQELLKETGVSSKFSAVIMKCTAKDPDERFMSVAEIQNVLSSYTNKNQTVYRAAGKNAVEISVSGIQRGIGVTHFCMLFGMWLKNKGFKTAVLEYCEYGDTLDLCKLLGKEPQLSKKGFYEIKGLKIYPSMGTEKIDSFIRADYDYILVDYGVHDEYISRLMPRSDVRLILAPGADWKINTVGLFIKKYERILKQPNTYVSFPMQDKKSVNIIRSYFRNINIITVPFAANPWRIDSATGREIESLYQKIFQVKRLLGRR